MNSANAFKYAYNKGCRDGLLVYRYGNVERLLKHAKKSISLLKSALPDLKQNYTNRLVNNAYFGLGDSYTQIGNHQAAANNYRQALAYKPDDVEAMLNLAHNLILVGKPGQAKKWIMKAKISGHLSPYGHKVAQTLLKKINSANSSSQ